MVDYGGCEMQNVTSDCWNRSGDEKSDNWYIISTKEVAYCVSTDGCHSFQIVPGEILLKGPCSEVFDERNWYILNFLEFYALFL